MRIDEPLMTLWFGNFYRPAYDDRDYVDESVRSIHKLGFNCVLLDSKAWEDFQQRFSGGEASQYVSQQEYIMDALHREGLAHAFLALYLNGDNLYPNIRFSPPVYGESVVNPDGSDGRWYRYWSEKARLSQQEHVRGLMSLYHKGYAQTDAGLPVCSMWDPVVAPSFDQEGQDRYRAWLQKRYQTIEKLNSVYQTSFASFEELRPRDYWFDLAFADKSCYTAEELEHNAPAFVIWADNMRWRADELTLYFADMKERLHGVDPSLYLMPNLSQWNHFLNIDTSRKSDIGLCELWDTAMRGIDMRSIAPHVDMCHYYTLPVTADGDPDAYVVSCQHAHIRSLNKGRPFIGGVFWGRFLYSDIYRYVTPEEVIGSIVLSGAGGISAYGWSGMDDGGLLHRMDEGFCDSLSRGNHWAKEVIPKIGQRRQSHIAILYPTAMALLEPLKVEGADKRRNDLLGLYHLCCDLGYAPDLVEAEDVIAGLDGYDVLLIAADDCYHAQRNTAMEQALCDYVRKGGVVIHGQHGEAAEIAFELPPSPTQSTCYEYEQEGGLLLGAPYVSYPGEALARWKEDGANCISRNRFGDGRVYSFGFMPGYQHAARTSPHVPQSQRNNALYPMTHMQRHPLKELLRTHARPDTEFAMKDVECAAFENGLVIVNHRSTAVVIKGRRIDGHSAVYLESK